MSKLHRDNAGYVGCSYEETQDPYYSYNKLSLPLSQSDKTVVRDEVTFTVTVAGGKFVIDGTSQATVSLLEGNVYTFDQSDSSNGTHPLRFSYTADGTHAGGGREHTQGVTTNGTPGQSGAYTRIVVPFGLHDLKYYCSSHSGMGGSANVVKNTKAFTVGRPILKTTDAFGKTLGSGNNADPYAANLVLAIPMNGSNNGTTFTDVSNVIRGTGTAKTITINGNAKTSTAESFYYGSSGLFDGSGDRLVLGNASDLVFNGDFTMETWLYINDANSVSHPNGDRQIAGVWTGSNNDWLISYSGTGSHNKFLFQIYTDGGVTVFSSGVDMSAYVNKWVHLAVVRDNGAVQLYVDGVPKGDRVINHSSFGKTSNVAVGGRVGGDSNTVAGYLADFRIYNGVAKYTTPFPTGSYGMDVAIYKGNGGTQTIGPVYSAGATATGGFESSHPAANGFNGTLTSGNRANGVTVGGTIEIVFNPGLSVSSNVGIWSGKSGFKYQINDSGSYTSVTNATEQWHDASFSGTLKNLKIQHTASNEAPGFSGIRVDGSTLIDGNGLVLNFKSDLVWLKSTDNAYDHHLIDSVRGVTKALFSNRNLSEQTYSNGLTSFNSNGFTLGGEIGHNGSNKEYVAWAWKAGGTSSTLAVGSKNSDAYNQSQTWDGFLSSPNGAYSNSPISNAFNGDLTSGFEAGNPSSNYSTIRFQPTSAITVNSSVRIYVFDLNASNVTYQWRVNDGSWNNLPGVANSPYRSWVDLNFTGSLGSFEYRSNTSITYKPTLFAVEIDGKRLVNPNISLSGLDQYPSVASTVSTSSDYGFSIVNYVSNSNNVLNVAHNLPSEPRLIFFKDRDNGTNWFVYHNDGSTGLMFEGLNTTAAGTTNLAALNNTKPNSHSITLNSGGYTVNPSGNHDMVAYCWSEVSGYSKFGSYESADPADVTVTLGFRPRWVLIKSADYSSTTTSWMIYDSARLGDSTMTNALMANKSATEGYRGDGSSTGSMHQQQIKFTETGFIVQGGGSEVNEQTGNTYIYAAFAEISAGANSFESVFIDQLSTDDLSGNSNNASNAGATFQTSVKKFYDGATYFDGSALVDLPESSDFAFGASDFTIEYWVNTSVKTADGVYRRMFVLDGPTGDTGANLSLNIDANSGHVIAWGGNAGPGAIVNQGVNIADGAWHHVACVRQGTSVSVYVDGSIQGTGTDNRSLFDSSTAQPRLGGASSTGGRMNGYMQDVRIYKGIAKYTSSFSPPERSVQGTARRYPSGVYVVS